MSRPDSPQPRRRKPDAGKPDAYKRDDDKPYRKRVGQVPARPASAGRRRGKIENAAGYQRDRCDPGGRDRRGRERAAREAGGDNPRLRRLAAGGGAPIRGPTRQSDRRRKRSRAAGPPPVPPPATGPRRDGRWREKAKRHGHGGTRRRVRRSSLPGSDRTRRLHGRNDLTGRLRDRNARTGRLHDRNERTGGLHDRAARLGRGSTACRIGRAERVYRAPDAPGGTRRSRCTTRPGGTCSPRHLTRRAARVPPTGT